MNIDNPNNDNIGSSTLVAIVSRKDNQTVTIKRNDTVVKSFTLDICEWKNIKKLADDTITIEDGEVFGGNVGDGIEHFEASNGLVRTDTI
jgi:hypothetical protein